MESESPIRVLIAEDDPTTRECIAELVRAFGHAVVAEVASGTAVVEFVTSNDADVALLDVHMPGLDGLAAAQQIRTQRPEMAVVLITGDSHVTVDDTAVGATSALAFLPKPVTGVSLDATIRFAVRRMRELTATRTVLAATQRQIETRKATERAKGILMRRTRCSEAEALAMLERASETEGVTLPELSRSVVASEPNPRTARA